MEYTEPLTPYGSPYRTCEAGMFECEDCGNGWGQAGSAKPSCPYCEIMNLRTRLNLVLADKTDLCLKREHENGLLALAQFEIAKLRAAIDAAMEGDR